MTHCGLVLLWMCACAMGRKQSTLWPFQLLNGHGFQSCQDCSFNRSDAAFVWSNIWILRSISLLVCYWCDILIKLSLQQEITSFKRMLIVLIQPFLRISTYNMTLFQTVVYHQRCSRAARFSNKPRFDRADSINSRFFDNSKILLLLLHSTLINGSR